MTYRQAGPGALAAAVIWQLLQWFGAIYVAHVVESSSATNGVFAVVLGLLALSVVTVFLRLAWRTVAGTPSGASRDAQAAQRAQASRKLNRVGFHD